MRHKWSRFIVLLLRNLATVGGSIFGRFGFSDVLTLFLALDAQMELYHAGTVPLEQFVQMKPDRDILVLTCALSRMEGEYRAVYGARPARAMVLRDTEGLLKEGVTPDSAQAFAQYAAEHVPTGSNTRGSAAYRTHLIKVLTQRGLLELGGKPHGN